MEEFKLFYDRLTAMSPSMRILITLVSVFVIVSLIAVPPATLGFFMKVFGFSTIALLVIAMWKDWTLLMIDQIAERYFNKQPEFIDEQPTFPSEGRTGHHSVESERDTLDTETEAEDPPHHPRSRTD